MPYGYFVLDDIVDPESGEVVAEKETVVEGDQADAVASLIDGYRDYFHVFPRSLSGDGVVLTVVGRIHPQEPKVELTWLDMWALVEASFLAEDIPGQEYLHGILRMPGDEPDWEAMAVRYAGPLG